ncbi:hypothetical protein ACFL19_00740 [Pseudomonadota bacterium]
MAVAHDESPHESLNLSSDDFEPHVKQAFNNPDMGGNLFQKLVTDNTSNESTDTKYFCVSERNIELAIRYAQDGNNSGLKADCTTALAKIAEGPILLKQLLRKAQITAQNRTP